MKENRKQTIRLMKFIIEMKRNRYPNSERFADLLRRADIDENIDIACTPRTVQRDIELLKNSYNAPIMFDALNNGYFLTDPTWTLELELPMEQREFVVNTLLGAKALEDIAPQPLKATMAQARDRATAINESKFLDKDFVESLIVASGLKVVIDSEIFKTILEAWRMRHSLNISYSASSGNRSEREIEPHMLAFHNGLWYIQAVLNDKAIRSFAIHRILDATITDRAFKIDKALVDDVKKNGLFTYPKVTDVKLLCDKSIAFYLKERQIVKRYKLKEANNGQIQVTIHSIFEHDLIKWVLSEAGRIKILSPDIIRQKVLKAAQSIIENNNTL